MIAMTQEGSGLPSHGAGPLDGVKVIELGTVVMAPYSTQILGDLGAEIIKVETFEGDSNRSMAGGDHPQLSGMVMNLHRNKRSLAVDLKSAAGRDAVARLVETADVVVTNMRPGALQRLRLDYDSLADACPRLVYVEAHGFSIESGRAEEPSYDDTIQSLTGVPMLNERLGSRVMFAPTLLADKVAAHVIVEAALAGLVRRGVTGKGQRVELPMFDTILAFMLTEHLGLAAFPGGRTGYSRVLTANRGPHRTSDGWLALMPYNDRQWKALFEEAGRAELLDSPSHASMAARLRDADIVYGELKTVIATRTTQEWLETCHRLDVPVAIVPSLDDIVVDESLHNGVITELEHPVVGTYRSVRQPLRFYGSPTRETPMPAPLIGQDTDAILEEIGYAPDEIARLHDESVVHGTAEFAAKARA
jgi:crotonobetainyl-CoA:carnitine CoA-transferase CaiB-like acyl-CoA transferase